MIASETATLSGGIIISLLKGLAIGLVFGAPVGVAGIMSMQRTMFARASSWLYAGLEPTAILINYKSRVMNLVVRGAG